MKNKFITYNYSKFHYSVSDNDGMPKILMIAGYGQDSSIFESWETEFPDYQLIALDMFGHGKTDWKHNEVPSLKDWEFIIKEITENTNFNILAYSIGAAPALSLLHNLSDKIAKIILIAPTGIYNDKMYHFAVNTALGRGIFKQYVKHGTKLQFVYSLMENIGMIDKKFKAFLLLKTGSKELRETLKNRWLLFRHLFIKPHLAVKIINEKQIPLMLIGGKDDVVIKPKTLGFFTKKINSVFLYWVDADHHLLRNPVNKNMLEKIKMWLN